MFRFQERQAQRLTPSTRYQAPETRNLTPETSAGLRRHTPLRGEIKTWSSGPGQSPMALPLNRFSGIGVLEYWKNRNSKSQLIRFQCSGFRGFSFSTLNLTPEAQNPEIWCLEFDILQYSNTPLLQLTHVKGKDYRSPLWGQIKAGSSGPGFFTSVSILFCTRKVLWRPLLRAWNYQRNYTRS